MMTISGEALKELQDALGPENVSDDPGVLQSYSYMNSIGSNMTGVWQMRPACVVLPGSREDVQAVLEICRKHGLKFKPLSTGWVFLALATCRNCVIMDLRRMNNILEINERDGYMVVEPYVTSGQSQVELMKSGLNCHHIGSGPNCSNLASATSFDGTGGTGVTTSRNERNILGIELVTAGGEVLHMGSVGTPNAGWFCGDGPGPSLRGMMRGSLGNFGSQGVYTKAALKCYPWYQEPYRCGGSPPFFESEEILNFAVRLVRWDDVDDECDGVLRITESELVDNCDRLGPGAFEECMSTTNEEYLSIRDSGIYRSTFPTGVWLFSMIACSERALSYKLEALEKIVDKTNGIAVDAADFGRDAYEVVIQNVIRQCWVWKAGFMPTGQFCSSPPGSFDALDMLRKFGIKVIIDLKTEWIEKGAIEDDYADNAYMQLDEHGHFGHNESAYHTDHWEPKVEPTGMFMKSIKVLLEQNIQPSFSVPTPIENVLKYASYARKIQQMIDPERIADSFVYHGFFGMMRNMAEVENLE